MIAYNINKIHSDILSEFFKDGEVAILEKSNKKFGNFFEISVINGGKEVKMIIPRKEIDGDNFNWFYFSNPLNESSDFVERNSNIENIANDVRDIFIKNRFSEEYIKENN